MVPAEFPCSARFIRLEGDFCGAPLSGIWMLRVIITEFINWVVGLTTSGTDLSDLVVGFSLILGALLLVLPFISTLRLILAGSRRTQQLFSVAAWGLAAGISLLVGLSSYPNLYWVLWGTWVYIGLTFSAHILEVLTIEKLGIR